MKNYRITSWNRMDQSSILCGIVLEYIPSASSGTSDPPMATDRMRSALRADLKQLHKDGFCHNDIKLNNLLFDQVRQKIL